MTGLWCAFWKVSKVRCWRAATLSAALSVHQPGFHRTPTFLQLRRNLAYRSALSHCSQKYLSIDRWTENISVGDSLWTSLSCVTKSEVGWHVTTSDALAVTAAGPNDEWKKHLFTAALLVMKTSHIDRLEHINCNKVVIRSICISQPNERVKIWCVFAPSGLLLRDRTVCGYFIKGRTGLLCVPNKNHFQTLPFTFRGEHFIHLPRFIKHLAGSHTL